MNTIKSANSKNKTDHISDKSSKWFDELIATINTHRLMLETDVANNEHKNFYNLLITGSEIEISAMGHELTRISILKNMLIDYLQEISNKKIKPEKIAFNHTNSGLLVWAVIADNDEKSENDLLLSAAKINSKYSKYGFSINSTILEKSDNYPIPKHYNIIN